MNISNTEPRYAGAIPIPLSRILTTTRSRPLARRADSCTRPPWFVYLAAFVSRLANTCVRRTASPEIMIGFARQLDVELVRRGVEHRPRGLHGDAQQSREIHGLAPHVDHSAGNARDLEEIVDEPHEMRYLTLHDVRHAPDLGIRGGAQPEQLQSREQRRERIAQLVTERRQEFVLALIGGAQRFRRALALLEMAADLVLTFARTHGALNGAQ